MGLPMSAYEWPPLKAVVFRLRLLLLLLPSLLCAAAADHKLTHSDYSDQLGCFQALLSCFCCAAIPCLIFTDLAKKYFGDVESAVQAMPDH